MNRHKMNETYTPLWAKADRLKPSVIRQANRPLHFLYALFVMTSFKQTVHKNGEQNSPAANEHPRVE